jgi:hypothetical protein
MAKSRPARMDEKLFSDLFKAGAVRIEKNLSKCSPREMTMPKISNLATRCPSYPKLLEELKKMPERKKSR